MTHAEAAWGCTGHARDNELRVWVRGTQSLIARLHSRYEQAMTYVLDGLQYIAPGAGRRLLGGSAQCRANQTLDEALDEHARLTSVDSAGGIFEFSHAKQHYYPGTGPLPSRAGRWRTGRRLFPQSVGFSQTDTCCRLSWVKASIPAVPAIAKAKAGKLCHEVQFGRPHVAEGDGAVRPDPIDDVDVVGSGVLRGDVVDVICPPQSGRPPDRFCHRLLPSKSLWTGEGCPTRRACHRCSSRGDVVRVWWKRSGRAAQ